MSNAPYFENQIGGTPRLRPGAPLRDRVLAAWLWPTSYGRDCAAGVQLSPFNAPIYDGSYGMGGYTLAVKQGYVATCPTALRLQMPFTLVWLGWTFGVPNGNATIFGVNYDTAGSSPYLAYALFLDALGHISLFTNNGALQQVNWSSDPTNTGRTWIAATVASGSQALYVNDPVTPKGTGSSSGTIQYGATAPLSFGEPTNASTTRQMARYGLIISGVCTSAELKWLYDFGETLFSGPTATLGDLLSVAIANSVGPAMRLIPVPESIPQGVARRVPLQAYLSSDHYTPATGETIAVQGSVDGAAYANLSGGAVNATEIGHGSYYVDVSTTDTGTLGPLLIRGTATGVDDVLAFYDVVPAGVQQRLTRNAALGHFGFPMTLADHITPATGKTVAGNVSIDGAAEIALTNTGAIAEIGHGSYDIDLVAADTDGDTLVFRFSAAGCDDTKIYVVTQL
jgi:hypothetical protein